MFILLLSNLSSCPCHPEAYIYPYHNSVCCMSDISFILSINVMLLPVPKSRLLITKKWSQTDSWGAWHLSAWNTLPAPSAASCKQANLYCRMDFYLNVLSWLLTGWCSVINALLLNINARSISILKSFMNDVCSSVQCIQRKA